MSGLNGYAIIYKSFHAGGFWFNAPKTLVGNVKELICKKYESNPVSYNVELSGTIEGKITNYLPILKNPIDESKPREILTEWELPHLLENINIEVNVNKKYNPKTMLNEKISINLRKLELNYGETYRIKYDHLEEAYLLKNFKLKTYNLEEKDFVKPKKQNPWV